jgi:carboxylesterase
VPQDPPSAPASNSETGGPGLDTGCEIDLPGGPDAWLLLHGLTGSTFELHPLAARLHAAGARVLAPLLAGHGGAAEALRDLPWTDWLAAAARDLGRLHGARRTFLLGCSTGSLLACALARDHPAAVNGLVLLSPALELTFPGRLAARLGRRASLRRRIVPKLRSDVRDREMGRRNRGLSGVPLGAVAELEALARHVERLLPEVSAPALVLVGRHDRTVTLRGARRLAHLLGGPAELHLLARSGHLLGIDVERDCCA